MAYGHIPASAFSRPPLANSGSVKNEYSQKKYNWPGYLFILPSILFFLFYILYPIVFAGYGSLFSWSNLLNMKFVGLQNYAKLFSDPVFLKVMRNVVYWILITVIVQAAIGFTLAYIIEEKLPHFKGFFRTLFFLPVVTSVVVIAILWANIYKPYQGILANFLSLFGIGIIDFLGNTRLAIFSIILVNIWEWTGWSMVLYVAGINQIPEEIKEAASIDGASGLQQIFRIYLPSLSGTHKSLVVLGIIGSLQTFALIYSMTGGGPNHATEMPGTYIFQTGFSNQQMGYASAISMAILLLALVLTAIQVLFLGSGNFTLKRRKQHEH